MLYKYCPNCFSLGVKRIINSDEYKCEHCNYIGEVKEDSIDKINLYRKQNIEIKNKPESNLNQPNMLNKKDNLVSIKEKLKNKFGEKSGDWEFV